MNDLNLYEKGPIKKFPIYLSLKKGSVGFPPHWHEHLEIHFAKRGSFKMIWNNRTHILKENECAIVNANELHEGAGTNCDDCVIMIHPSFFEGNHIIFSHLLCDDVVSELVLKLFEELENKLDMNDFAVKGYTYQLVTYLCRNYSVAQISEGNYRAITEKHRTVNRIIEYINTHFYEDITTRQLADAVHLSQSHFCHIFKEITDKSAKEYLINVRIGHATVLLQNTDMNMTEIAFACGFFDANYFSRAFRKVKGMNPTEYKRMKIN